MAQELLLQLFPVPPDAAETAIAEHPGCSSHGFYQYTLHSATKKFY